MKRLFGVVCLAAALVASLLLAGSPASAKAGNGMVQLSATGDPFSDRVCDDDEGADSDLALPIEPSDEGWSIGGCLYQFFGPARVTPSGMFNETGDETFVGTLYYNGVAQGEGTFDTTYRFTAKFDDPSDPSTEIFGRCQHPIVTGSGTGVFDGAKGRLDFKDFLTRDDNGELLDVFFAMRGHLTLR